MEFAQLKAKFNKYKSYVDQRQGAYDSLVDMKHIEEKRFKDLQKQQILYHKALLFLQSEIIEKRKEAKEIIESLGTSALQYIFDKSYSLILDTHEEKKKDDLYNLKMEFLIKNKHKQKELLTGLIGERGGGVVEIVSFSLRIAALNLLHYPGPLLIDEAYKSVSNDGKLINVAQFLRQITDNLERQIIFSTHKGDIFNDVANKIFLVEKDDEGVAHVKTIGEKE